MAMKKKFLIDIVWAFGLFFLATMVVNIFVPRENPYPRFRSDIKQGLTIKYENPTLIDPGYRIYDKPVLVSDVAVSSYPVVNIPKPGPVARVEKEKVQTVQTIVVRADRSKSEDKVTKEKQEKVSSEELNPYSIENIIKASGETYYFNDRKTEKDNVSVDLISLTPRKKDYILKFRITNMSKDYFIPQSISVSHQDIPADIQVFLGYIVEASQTKIGYIQVRKPYTRDGQNSLQITESGGKYRKFRISF